MTTTAKRFSGRCQSCHERPVSKKPQSIFCDECADRIGNPASSPESVADLFASMAFHTDPDGFWARQRDKERDD